MVVFGVDAHKQSLAIAGIDALGRRLCGASFRNDPAGHRALSAWAAERGPAARRFGIEGAGSFGRALALALVGAGEAVVEVPTKLTDAQRARMAGQGKSDERDALAIARAVLREGERLRPLGPELPGARELKLLSDYRRQLIGERTRTANRLHADLVVLCPGYERRCGALRAAYQLRGAGELLAAISGVQARLALRRLERLVLLDGEIRTLGRELAARVRTLGTGLVEHPGIGAITAAQIIGEVRDPRRFATANQFARANGTAPIPASSGARTRHRLNRGGNRRLNHALHVMALTQAGCDPRARAYLARRRAQGRTGRDGLRALKRRLSDVAGRRGAPGATACGRSSAGCRTSSGASCRPTRGCSCRSPDEPGPSGPPPGRACLLWERRGPAGHIT